MSAAAGAAGAWGRLLPAADGSAGRRLRAALGDVALFCALAGLAMAMWARLVEPPAAGRLTGALVAVAAGALILRLLEPMRAGRGRRLAALLAAGATLAAALLAAGLPLHMLAPAGWGELREEVQGAVGAIEQAQLPYSGADPWIRLTLTLGAPALVALAAIAAFWPTPHAGRRRIVALAVLLIAYGVATTLDNPGAEALWGVVLLVLAAAWLWIGRLAPERRPLALAATLAAGVLALPVAARLNGPAWWDYENWSWFGARLSVSFDWDHSYGPLDWPRDGTTLMTVRTDTPLYWKASVLDRFNGYVWERAAPGDVAAGAERAARAAIPGQELPARHPGWISAASFELRALTSDLVIGAGTTQSIDGLDGTLASADGTLTRVGTPLERGQEYSIVSYVPRPTHDQLRRAPPPRSSRRLAGSTLLALPPGSPGSAAAVPATSMGLWGDTDAAARARLLASPYADVFRLAREWTAGARTPYDAVRSIERHLRREYAYTPSVPEHAYPLDAFLFSDRAGYCQQFAGAMALMLRMVGIPARVVSGFAPGSPDETTAIYEVHDYDAHSWVEVFFRGIGWVTFDPTPDAAPAESQRLGGEFATALRGPAPDPVAPEVAAPGREQSGGPREGATAASSGGGPWAGVGLALGIAAAIAVGALAAVALRRRRRLRGAETADAQIAELVSALRRFGWRVGPRTTLHAIERRCTGAVREPIRRYARALAASRYGPTAGTPPGPAERRAVRRALGAGGAGRRLRALWVIPPGGPVDP